MWEKLENLVISWINTRFDSQEVDDEAWQELEEYLRSTPSSFTTDVKSTDSQRIPREIRQAYFDLELTPDASHEEVRSAYRKLLLTYHPDRFHNDSVRAKKASEIVHRVSMAYKRLSDYYR